jgi:hypothetical protein
VECQLFEGEYQLTTIWDGTFIYLENPVTSQTQPLVGPTANNHNCSSAFDLSQPCWTMATNYRATAEAFAQLLVGMIDVNEDGDTFSFVGSPATIPLFNISTVISPSQDTWSFDLQVSNLSTTLEGMFANVIASIMFTRMDTDTVQVLFFGSTVWEYDIDLLWQIYGPTLFVFGLFAAHGLWCIIQGGTVESTFMNFLVSTRGEDFDRAVTNAGDIDKMKGIVVTYAKSGGFEVVVDSMSQTVA